MAVYTYDEEADALLLAPEGEIAIESTVELDERLNNNEKGNSETPASTLLSASRSSIPLTDTCRLGTATRAVRDRVKIPFSLAA